MADTNLIRNRIDTGPVTPVMLLVIFFGFLLNLVDGFDVVAMSVSAPSLIKEWGVTRNELGPIFSAALVGMAIGAAVLAPLADKYGRRLMLLTATSVIGLSMIATGLIPKSIYVLVALRFIAGLGIGIIFANGATIASEVAPERYRNLAVTMAIMGYPFGAMVIGPIANIIIPSYGWEMVFVFGGVSTLIAGFLVWLALPESVDFLANKADRSDKDLAQINQILARMRREPIPSLPTRLETDDLKPANVSSLLTPELRTSTLSIWTIYFMGFLTIYFLLSWIPTLFVDSGYTRAEGIRALTYHTLGAVIGTLIIGIITTRVKLAKPTAIYFFGSALFLAAVFYLKPQGLVILNAMIFAIGFLLQGGFVALYAVAARVYPTRVRATGVGWGAGLGRIGAIIAPIGAGHLAAQGWEMYSLFLLFAAPMVIAAALVARFKV